MRALHKPFLIALALMATAGSGPVCAAPPSVSPPVSSAPVPSSSAIPDYGGRDSAPLTASDTAPNPAAQAGRAVEALVLVLAAVVGVVYALKRFGWVQPSAGGKPARIRLSGRGLSPSSASLSASSSAVTVESSQTLPGGAILHVVTVPGRTLLLAATPHTITSVAEWPAEAETAAEAAAFEQYLARADAPGSGIAAANARLRSLLSRPQPPLPKDTL